MMYGLSKSDLAYIISVLGAYPNVEQAILFGSRAKKTNRPGSDIDLALKGESLADMIPQISGKLNEELPLPYYFDVLDYDSLNHEELKAHIDRVGCIIYDRARQR